MTTSALGADLVRLRRTTAPSAAARDLLDRAARYDAEMGFGPPRPDRGGSSGATTVIEIDTCLHRHDVDHDDAYVLAGVLTIRDLGDGTGAADLVVDPRRRAIGVATAVGEELGTRAGREGGWAGTGLHTLHAVAHGSHPAAERLARRSGVTTAAVRHHLVLPPDEPTPADAGAPTAPDEGGADGDAVRIDVAAGTATVRHAGGDGPAEITAVAAVPGTAGHERSAALGSVVATAVGRLRAAGAGAVEAVAADDDEPLLEALRRQLFEHDRSDLVFRIGRPTDR
jgi:mycothiol synthase